MSDYNRDITGPDNGMFPPGLKERNLEQGVSQKVRLIASKLQSMKLPNIPPPEAIQGVEIMNGPEHPAHFRLDGILNGLIRGNTGTIHWDNLRVNKTRTDSQSWTIDPLTYDMAGQVAWAYFYGGPNRFIQIPAQNVRWKDNPNGTGNYRNIGDARAGDYPYIVPSPEVQLPGSASDSEIFTVMYMPNISSPSNPQPPGTYQEPFKVGPINVPLGFSNRATLMFGFSFGLDCPKVSFFYNKDGDPIDKMPCQEVNYKYLFDSVGPARLIVGMQYWSDLDTSISVKIEVAP